MYSLQATSDLQRALHYGLWPALFSKWRCSLWRLQVLLYSTPVLWNCKAGDYNSHQSSSSHPFPSWVRGRDPEQGSVWPVQSYSSKALERSPRNWGQSCMWHSLCQMLQLDLGLCEMCLGLATAGQRDSAETLTESVLEPCKCQQWNRDWTEWDHWCFLKFGDSRNPSRPRIVTTDAITSTKSYQYYMF